MASARATTQLTPKVGRRFGADSLRAWSDPRVLDPQWAGTQIPLEKPSCGERRGRGSVVICPAFCTGRAAPGREKLDRGHLKDLKRGDLRGRLRLLGLGAPGSTLGTAGPRNPMHPRRPLERAQCVTVGAIFPSRTRPRHIICCPYINLCSCHTFHFLKLISSSLKRIPNSPKLPPTSPYRLIQALPGFSPYYFCILPCLTLSITTALHVISCVPTTRSTVRTRAVNVTNFLGPLP